jgi:hypothetical protein
VTPKNEFAVVLTDCGSGMMSGRSIPIITGTWRAGRSKQKTRGTRRPNPPSTYLGAGRRTAKTRRERGVPGAPLRSPHRRTRK